MEKEAGARERDNAAGGFRVSERSKEAGEEEEGFMSTSEGGVIACHNHQEWKNQIQASIASKKLVVVDFTASWCGPCRFIAPIFAEWARKFVDAIFLKVDVDEVREVAEEWKVEAMPTFLYLKEGKEVDRIVGARKEDINRKIIEHLSPPVSA